MRLSILLIGLLTLTSASNYEATKIKNVGCRYYDVVNYLTSLSPSQAVDVLYFSQFHQSPWESTSIGKVATFKRGEHEVIWFAIDSLETKIKVIEYLNEKADMTESLLRKECIESSLHSLGNLEGSNGEVYLDTLNSRIVSLQEDGFRISVM